VKNARFISVPIACAVVWLAGCASTVLQPSGPKAPTDPASVRLYQNEPKKYEDLGVVEVTENVKYEDNFGAKGVADQLRAKAAARGANGVYLFPALEKNMIGVGAFDGDNYYTFPVRREGPRKIVLGRAMFVIE
jgi:hypothetical protein